MSEKKKSKLIIAVIILYTLVNILVHIFGGKVLQAATIGIGLTVFTYLHGSSRYSLKDLTIFFALATVFGLFYENLSILTGFPFGFYVYADGLGPYLLHAPILIAPAYFALGYISWNTTSILLNNYSNKLQGWNVIIFPVISTFVTVMIDIVLDPTWATIENTWIWFQGGPYFGIPLSNFLGWYLCVFTYMLCFSVYLSKKKNVEDTEIMKKKSFWYQVAIMYGLIVIQIPILAILNTNEAVTTHTGQIWYTNDIYWSSTLIAIATVGFVSLLSVINVWNNKSLEKKSTLISEADEKI